MPVGPNAGFTCTIANGGTTPDVGVAMGAFTPTGVYIPTGFDGATLAFTACSTLSGTYLPVYDLTGAAVSIPAGASRYIPLDPVVFAGVAYLKPVVPTQTGAIVLTIAGRKL